MKLPKTMMALVQEGAGQKPVWKEVEIPQPQKGEVLVKMAYSIINPSDINLLKGIYAEKPSYPTIPGIEGSGIVVANGGGIIGKMRLGKNVSCTKKEGRGGSWAEYMITNATNVIPLGKIPLKEGAGFIVNPLTAVAFMNIAKKGKHQTIYNNAAGGALGKMLINLSKLMNINIINSVRSEEQKLKIQQTGAKFILNSSDKNFENNLTEMFSRLKPTLIFDAVGGSEFSLLLKNAPKDSVIIPYANLSNSESIFDQRILLQKNVKIEGFFLGHYSHQAGMIKVLRNISKAKKLYSNSLNIAILKTINPLEIHVAIDEYSSGMSKGKILISLDKE